MATVTAGSVLIEVQLDTKKARAQLDQFKQKMKGVFGSIQTSVQNVGVQAALVGSHLAASAKQGAAANKELLDELRRVRGGLDGVTNASKRLGKESATTYDPRHVKGYNSNLRNTSEILQSVHGRLLILSSVVTATFGKAISVGATFENEMRKVKAVVGATEQELLDLTDTARMLGKTTTFMASEVARGMKILGQAGFSTREIKAAIGDVLNLARAGSVTLERAAQVMISVGRTFDIEASKIGDVGDILVKVANNSATNIDLLGASFSFVGATAVSTGQKLTDISSMLGVLANRGLRGTKAGTALNEALLRLSQTDTVERMRKLGIAVEDAEGNMRPLAQIFLDLKNATSDFSAVRQAGEFIDIFGRRGARAGLLIARAGGDVAAMNKLLKDFKGEANKTARDMEKDLLSQFRLLRSAAEELAISFKDALAPSIVAAVQQLKGMALSLSNLIQTFPEAGKGIGYLASAFASLAAALVTYKYILIPFGAVFTAMAAAVSTAVSVLVGLASTFAAVVTGAGLLAGALALVVAGLVALAGYTIFKNLSVVYDYHAALVDIAAAQKNYNKELAKTAAMGPLSESAASDLVQKKIEEMQAQGKNLSDIQAELRKLMGMSANKANMYSAKIKAGGLSKEEIDAYTVLMKHHQAYALALKASNGELEKKVTLDKELVKGAADVAKEKAYAAHLQKIERMEEKHQNAMRRLREETQAAAHRMLVQRRRKDSPAYAVKRAKWDAMAVEQEMRKASERKNALMAKTKGGGTEEEYAAIEAVNQRLLDLTKQKKQAEEDVTKALKAQREAVASLRQKKEKAAAKAQKDQEKDFEKYNKAGEKMAELRKRQSEDMQKFLESFVGVRNTAVVTGGGSLSEQLGATDPSIALGKKALREQERQTEKMEEQYKVQVQIRDNLVKLNPTFK